jgi:hypothetical protein
VTSAFYVYLFVALACAAVVLFIVIQYFRSFIAFVSGIYKRRVSRKRAVERLSQLKRGEPQPSVCTAVASVAAELTLEHAELPLPEPAVSEDLPQLASVAAEPTLEHAEPPLPEPAVSEDLPQQASVAAEPTLEHAEPSQPEPAVSEDLPQQASVAAEPTLEHAEPPLPEPAVSEDLPQLASVAAEPILEHAEPPLPEPAVSGHPHNSQTYQTYHDGFVANYDESRRTSEPRLAMKEARAFRGSIGVTIRRVTEGIALAFNINPVRGALVAGIDENGPAKFSGIELGDVIVKVDGNAVKEWRDLPNALADMPAGKEVAVTIIRKGKELIKTVKVGQLDDTDEQKSFNSQNRDASHERSSDLKSESASVVVEIQQPVSSVPAFVVPAPTRFGKRHMDHRSKVTQG